MTYKEKYKNNIAHKESMEYLKKHYPMTYYEMEGGDNGNHNWFWWTLIFVFLVTLLIIL